MAATESHEHTLTQKALELRAMHSWPWETARPLLPLASAGYWKASQPDQPGSQSPISTTSAAVHPLWTRSPWEATVALRLEFACSDRRAAGDVRWRDAFCLCQHLLRERWRGSGRLDRR